MKTQDRAAVLAVLTVFVVLASTVASIEYGRRPTPASEVVWHPYTSQVDLEVKRSEQGLIFCSYGDWAVMSMLGWWSLQDEEVKREVARGSWHCVGVNLAAWDELDPDEHDARMASMPIQGLGTLIVSKSGERIQDPNRDQLLRFLRKHRT